MLVEEVPADAEAAGEPVEVTVLESEAAPERVVVGEPLGLLVPVGEGPPDADPEGVGVPPEVPEAVPEAVVVTADEADADPVASGLDEGGGVAVDDTVAVGEGEPLEDGVGEEPDDGVIVTEPEGVVV